MSSRWQANKIGLLNFWYYEEQEFPFVKGRMLLRGSNGSGKSVTMQSVVPLLLDGNMSPERLDPFGSRDRKMSSYLLEEDDVREERTGYLYLEFKRQESETYLTIGMGIRARKGKPLDKWYFSLTDGRRIGKDFFLYKEMGEKVTLSRKELENRIAQGGHVFDRQSEYMDYVNRQIFGFETSEEYKEMIDLLIQLRTPKLSKDFKPSVINDILSDSLQPLSDDDLRPMSEAIENMDTMSMNLKLREEGKQAAEKIRRIFDRYNGKVLYDKAENYDENHKNLNSLEREEHAREKEIEECRKRAEELDQEQNDLEAKKEAMEKERESLSKSDAVGLKQRELELAAQIGEQEKLLKEKESQLEGKQEQYRECETLFKKEEDREYAKKEEIEELLEEMQSEADEMCFQEHAFFSGELQDNLSSGFSFDTHQGQFEKTQDHIRKGLEILRQADAKQRLMEELLLKRDRHQRETDAAQRRVTEQEAVLIQVENEWKEALYTWSGQNTELVISREQLQTLARFADDYNEKSDFAGVRQSAADIWLEKKEKLTAEMGRKREQERILSEEYEEQKAELAEWENQKEPEPERSEAVKRNRELLREKKIPYLEFYKVLEFGQNLDKVSCDRLEESLLRMGILDALVVPEEYREQILAMGEGVCDRYLFQKKQRADRSLLDVLDLNDQVNDIFLNQQITGILAGIAYDGEGLTSVSTEGSYQIGPLTGTITEKYEAGFLGSQARERNRQAKILACQNTLEEISLKLGELSEEIEELQSRIKKLEEEYLSLPSDEDMKEAFYMLRDAREVQARMLEESRRLEEQLRVVSEELRGMKAEAMQIADKLYLTCSFESFRRADEAARTYGQHFYQLRSGHELYLQIVYHLRELEERMKDLDIDLDQIRYDAGNTSRALKRNQEERESILRQLGLTDYEQIKYRLDACVGWLREYPGRLQQCVEERTQKRDQIRNLEEKSVLNIARIEEYRKRGEYYRKCFDAELALGYVELSDTAQKSPAGVRAELESEYAKLELTSVIPELNRIYFENRSFLNDYQLTQTELFGELDEEAEFGVQRAKRLDITARYQGMKIPFNRLLSCLEEEIEELKDLIRAGDRELFEDILANIVSRKIRGKINASNAWVEKMNALMNAMDTSSGLKLSLRWRSRTAESEDQLDTKDLVELLKKDYRLMRDEEAKRLSLHFRSKVAEARRNARDSGGMISFYQVMKETLDYRKWFEFQLFAQKSGQKMKELTNSVFGTFSGGEKAMAMYVPLFSAVVAKYQGGRQDAPRIISLDEAFAGVDNKNIRDMFRLMREFQFDFVINSQVLWGDCDTLDALAIYQLIRPENVKFVTVMPYLWNGSAREMIEDEKIMEERAEQYAG